MVTMAVLVCAAVALNWRYTDEGRRRKRGPKILGETKAGLRQDGEGREPDRRPDEDTVSARTIFRLRPAKSRPGQRHQHAQGGGGVRENAEQSVLNEASETLQVLAAYTVGGPRSRTWSLPKGYADCVAFMGRRQHQRGGLHRLGN